MTIKLKKLSGTQINAVLKKLEVEYGAKWNKIYMEAEKSFDVVVKAYNNANDNTVRAMLTKGGFTDIQSKMILSNIGRRSEMGYVYSYGYNQHSDTDTALVPPTILRHSKFSNAHDQYNHPIAKALVDLKFTLIMADNTSYKSIMADFDKTFAKLTK